mgnify:CR=1 FL=1
MADWDAVWTAEQAVRPRPGVEGQAWYDFVEHVAETLDIGPGTSVFAIGCRGGALVLPLAENGYEVGGLDASVGHVATTRRAMPAGAFVVGDPMTVDPAERWDVVVACDVVAEGADRGAKGAYDVVLTALSGFTNDGTIEVSGPDAYGSATVFAVSGGTLLNRGAIRALPTVTNGRNWLRIQAVDVKIPCPSLSAAGYSISGTSRPTSLGATTRRSGCPVG